MVPNIKEENVKAISRKDRMQQLNIKCDRIMHYLRRGKHMAGLTNNFSATNCPCTSSRRS